MITQSFKKTCQRFIEKVNPYIHIEDEKQYNETLNLIESLLDEPDKDTYNIIIELLSQSIETYENKDPEVKAFEKLAENIPRDIAMLNLIIEQYNLNLSDLPEIGSKSMVSRVLSGDRKLNKNHIKSLSERFGISPTLFF